MAQLHLIIGPMFSGKTTKLLSELVLMSDIRRKCLYINYSQDNRTDCHRDQVITTHHSHFSSLPETITTIKVNCLSEVNPEPYDVIGVDEGQFYPDLHRVTEWVYAGKLVIVSALDGDYQRCPFTEVLNLIPEADTVRKCRAYCLNCLDRGCYTPAPFTKRIVDSDQRILIGGRDSYIPVCRQCL